MATDAETAKGAPAPKWDDDLIKLAEELAKELKRTRTENETDRTADDTEE